jgi:tetrahydromethanopterin S-methyltransferase subunit G
VKSANAEPKYTALIHLYAARFHDVTAVNLMGEDIEAVAQHLVELQDSVDSQFAEFSKRLDRIEQRCEAIEGNLSKHGRGSNQKFEVTPDPDPEIRKLISMTQQRGKRQGVRTQDVAARLDVEPPTARRYMQDMAAELSKIKYVSGDNREPSKIVFDPE